MLLAAFYLWFWFSLRGEVLVDWRCPKLPTGDEFEDKFDRLSDNVAEGIRQVIPSFSGPRWILVIATVAILCLGVVSIFIAPGHVPLRSLEGLPFDWVYSILLGCALVVLTATLLRIFAIWRQFRSLLLALDRAGFKDTLQRLTGLEWNVIWNPAWNIENEGYKLIVREIDTIERLNESLGVTLEGKKKTLREEHLEKIIELREHLKLAHQGILKLPSFEKRHTFVTHFKKIQKEFAITAGFLCTSFLHPSWLRLPRENSKTTGGNGTETSGTKTNIGTDPIADLPGFSSNSLGLGEEFVGCVYSNFLVTVLLRIRGLVFSAVAIYALIVFSTISYPFQPAPDLSMLAIALFLVGAAVIGYVYEEMHRDPTLSRMTSTEPGKLDSAFWTKFVSAGIVPLVALISTVYPPFGHLLYSLLGPLLQALR